MNEAGLFALVDVAASLAEELRRRFGGAAAGKIEAFKISAEARSISIACGRDEDRRGGATAARGAAATLRIDAAADGLFLLSLHARSRRGLRPVPARASRERAVEIAEAFLCDYAERQAAGPARSRYDPRGAGR